MRTVTVSAARSHCVLSRSVSTWYTERSGPATARPAVRARPAERSNSQRFQGGSWRKNGKRDTNFDYRRLGGRLKRRQWYVPLAERALLGREGCGRGYGHWAAVL